jgi:DNA-binding beta-propeller fold protein YncE
MKKILLLIALSVYIVSCGVPQVVRRDYSGYVWPTPPEKPRIQLLNVIATDQDFRKPSMSERLFGEETFFAFRKPHGIVADTRGNIYVSDSALAEVFILNPENGTIRRLFNPYGYSLPLGLAYDDTLNWVAVADAGKKTVYVVDVTRWKLQLVIGQRGEFKRPVAVAFDSARKRIYVADTILHKIRVFDLYGKHLFDIGGKGAAPGKLYFPTGLTVDKEGNLYVVNSFNFRFDIFTPEGKFIKSIGSHGDVIGMFARPKDIALDSEGHIYVTDAAFNNFQIFDKEGRVYLFVGVGGIAPGTFSNIYSIYIDKNDKIYVTDQTNRRIQIFKYISYPEEKMAPIGQKPQTEETPPQIEQEAQTEETPQVEQGSSAEQQPEQPEEDLQEEVLEEEEL